MSEFKEPVKDVIDHEQRTAPPPMYSVVLHNDDFTTFEFVIEVLTQICNISKEQAFLVAKAVHEQGKGSAGVYTKDVAETKQVLIMDAAQQQEHPLKVTVEPSA